MNQIIKNTETVLHHFGITNRYFGYQSILTAMELLSEDPFRSTALLKEIYKPIGYREHRHWKSVERNIRTVVQQAWENNPGLMREIAGHRLLEAPYTCDFIPFLFAYVSKAPAAELTLMH